MIALMALGFLAILMALLIWLLESLDRAIYEIDERNE
jgi:hypothetical protein